MFKGFKVVVCTCTSVRRRHLQLMMKYLLRQMHIVDEWRLWTHADKELDKGAVEEIRVEYPEFIKVQAETKRTFWWTLPFYQKCCDKNTIYIKADDDIVFIADDAFEKLLAYRLKHPDPIAVHPNIVNNGICSFIHQQIGALDTHLGTLQYRFDDKLAILSMDFIHYLHDRFLTLAKYKEEGTFKFYEWVMREYQEFSINCYCFFGKRWAEFDGIINDADETWTTRTKPREIGVPGRICGQSLVVHYAYFPQREYLNTKTNIFDRYERLAEERCQ